MPKIACPDVGLYHECLYGFMYDGKEVEVEFTGDTTGKTRTFYLIEPTLAVASPLPIADWVSKSNSSATE